MRRFIVTSDKFEGQVELLYSTEEKLLCIDMRQANITPENITAFKRSVPVFIGKFSEAFSAGTIVVEADFEISLDDFKREYPYTRNYHLLPKRWATMNKADQVKAYYAAIEYRKYCKRNSEWYNMKIADTWLFKQEYLNDWKNM